MFSSTLVFFLWVGLASAFSINVTTPVDWTTSGPNNLSFNITSVETTSLRYDLILLFPISHPSRGIRQTLNLVSDRPVTASSSASSDKKDHTTTMQVFPVLGNHLLNVPDELPVGAGYVIEVRAHMDATKGRGFAGDPQTTFTEPFNVSKSTKPPQSLIAATAATNGAGSSSSGVGRLGAVLGFVVVVAGGLMVV